MADDLSTEGFGPLCWVLRNPDVVRLGFVGLGSVGLGREWRGATRLGMVTAADGSTGGFGSHCCSLWRVDRVRLGPLGLGVAR